LEPGAWLRADATFKASSGEEEGEAGRWHRNKPLPETWGLRVGDISVLARLTGFRHVGLFPEQVPHWEWMAERVSAIRHERPRVLNLFAYTGAASLMAAQAGAEVTHVDASKRAIAWAKQNQAVSKLGEAPIRWILDDARKFAARELRRGRTYHVILVDPPKFGRGPEGEVWDIFQHLAPLLRDCAALLAAGQAALVLTTAAIRASTSLQNERVKLIRSLEMRKARRETGLFAAEGASVLVTAREAGWRPRMLAFLAGSAQSGVPRGLVAWGEAAGAECLEVSEAVLAKLAAKDNPQTMLGVFEQRWAPEPQAAAVAPDATWLALEEIRDPGNLGTILRTADAVGAGGVILIGNAVDPY